MNVVVNRRPDLGVANAIGQIQKHNKFKRMMMFGLRSLSGLCVPPTTKYKSVLSNRFHVCLIVCRIYYLFISQHESVCSYHIISNIIMPLSLILLGKMPWLRWMKELWERYPKRSNWTLQMKIVQFSVAEVIAQT